MMNSTSLKLRRIGAVFLILSWVMLCGNDCHWGPRENDDDVPDPVETQTLSTRADATVITIYTTIMDVETDDDVILTCDLPTGVVLVVDDRVEIIIDFESNESNWVITSTEFCQKL